MAMVASHIKEVLIFSGKCSTFKTLLAKISDISFLTLIFKHFLSPFEQILDTLLKRAYSSTVTFELHVSATVGKKPWLSSSLSIFTRRGHFWNCALVSTLNHKLMALLPCKHLFTSYVYTLYRLLLESRHYRDFTPWNELGPFPFRITESETLLEGVQ